MIARLLRWNLALILAVAGVAALWSGPGERAGGAPGWTVFVALVLAPSALTTLATFAAATLLGSPPPPAQRLGPAAALAYTAREWWAFVFLFHLVQPFERWWMGADRLRRLGPGESPVLLVHGYGCNRGTWWLLRRRLEAAGHCVATLNLEPPFGSIGDYAERLRERIDAVTAATGAARVVVVAHSMGGLAMRAYLARHGAGRVAALASLGTPHRGSALARLGPGANAREMEPGSAFLERLALAPRSLPGGVMALYSLHDNYVMPQADQALEGADNRPLAGIGHLTLVLSGEVAGQLLAWLAGVRAAAR